MTVESATYISDLNPTYPTGIETNDASEGDNHLRLIKQVLKNTFPNVTGAVNATNTQLNVLTGLTASAAELNILSGVTITTAELNRLSGVTSNVQTQLNELGEKPTLQIKEDNFTAQHAYLYVLKTNSSKTLTLPASPAVTNYVYVCNVSGGSWTIARNGNRIMGAEANDTLANDKYVEYYWTNDTAIGWVRLQMS